jgi:AraC-like DNA-binding protein
MYGQAMAGPRHRFHARPAGLGSARPLLAQRYAWRDPAGTRQRAAHRWGGVVLGGAVRVQGPLGPPRDLGPGEIFLVAPDTEVLLISRPETVEMRLHAEPAHAAGVLARIRAGGGPDLAADLTVVRPAAGADPGSWAARLAAGAPPWLAEAWWWWLAAASAAAGPMPRRRPPAWLAAAVAACDSGDDLRSGLPALVRHAGRSTAHVNRCVQAAWGCTATELVGRLRMAMAERLLTGTDEPVAEIARRVGLANRSHFHRLFAAAHGGRGPGAWRRDPGAGI